MKFRVWDVKLKKYLEPEDCAIDGNGGFIFLKESQDERYTFALFPHKAEENYKVEFCSEAKDSNGKEIYEGDIVETINKTWYIVKIDIIMGVYLEDEQYKIPFYRLINKNDLRIIGNINENPELIKREEKEKEK